MIRILRPANVIVVVTTISDCEMKDPDDIKSWKCTAKNVKNHITQSKIILVDLFPEEPEISVANLFKTGVEIILAMTANMDPIPSNSHKRDENAPFLKVTSGDVHYILIAFIEINYVCEFFLGFALWEPVNGGSKNANYVPLFSDCMAENKTYRLQKRNKSEYKNFPEGAEFVAIIAFPLHIHEV